MHGRTIRDQRIKKGLTQAQLANKAGLDQSAVSLIETGRRGVSLRVLEALAAALGVETWRLLRDSGKAVE